MKQKAPLVEVMSQIAHIRSNAAPTNELIGSCSILHYLSGQRNYPSNWAQAEATDEEARLLTKYQCILAQVNRRLVNLPIEKLQDSFRLWGILCVPQYKSTSKLVSFLFATSYK